MNVNKVVALLLVLTLGIIAFVYINPSEVKAPLEIVVKETNQVLIPSFKTEMLHRKIEPHALMITRLQENLQFFGPNERPDQKVKKLFIGLKENPTLSIEIDQKIYIPFAFNKLSLKSEAIWIKVSEMEDKACVKIGKEPSDTVLGTITLRATPLIKKATWEVGGQKVDASLLTRLRAKWVGRDLFLQKHGNLEEEERIDFEGSPSCFVKTGSILFYKNGIWQNTDLDHVSEGFPILCVDKIEDKLMHLTLWSEEGDNKCQLKMCKYPEISPIAKVENFFHYVGAKTKKKWLFELSGKRVIVEKGDWWLKTQSGWQLLSKEEEIDEYLEQKLKGDLFVVSGCKSIKGGKALYGHIFNSLRTKIFNVEIPMKKSKSTHPMSLKQSPENRVKIITHPNISEDEEEEMEYSSSQIIKLPPQVRGKEP